MDKKGPYKNIGHGGIRNPHKYRKGACIGKYPPKTVHPMFPSHPQLKSSKRGAVDRRIIDHRPFALVQIISKMRSAHSEEADLDNSTEISWQGGFSMRKISFIIILTSFFLLSCLSISDAYEKEIRAISSALAENIATSGKKSIAVVDFTDLQGNVTELGRFLSEEFSVALSESGKSFEVVDRSQLNSILKEQKFSLSGLVDRKTVQKIGTIAGVQCLVTGTITPFGDSIRLAVKVLDTSTARVIGGSRGDIAKTKAIEELLLRGINMPSAASSPPPVTSFVSANTGPKSKMLGNIIVTVKKIAASQKQVDVVLDILNKSNGESKLAINQDSMPTMVDDKGNRFAYSGGLAENNPRKSEDNAKEIMERAGTTLFPQTNNDVTLKFIPYPSGQIALRDLGSKFDISINFMLYDRKTQAMSIHQTSFTDIPK